MSGPNEGDPAPAFELPTDGGGRDQLGRARGQALRDLLLPQGRHARLHQGGDRLLRASTTSSRQLGVEVIGVSKDSVASHDKFKKKYELCFPLGLRRGRRRSSRRSAPGSRRACTARSTWASTARPSWSAPTAGSRKAWRGVKVPGHVEEVLEAARAAGRAEGGREPAHARPLGRAALRLLRWRSALREHPAQRELREATDALPDGGMRSSAEQSAAPGVPARADRRPPRARGRLLHRLRHAGHGPGPAAGRPRGDARRQRATGPRSAARYWRAGGRRRADRAAARPGAGAACDRLLAEGAAGRFDLAYVDADKKRYDDLLRAALELVRPGGIVALDNVLSHGAVADPADRSPQTVTMRALNAKLPRGRAGVAGACCPSATG